MKSGTAQGIVTSMGIVFGASLIIGATGHMDYWLGGLQSGIGFLMLLFGPAVKWILTGRIRG